MNLRVAIVAAPTSEGVDGRALEPDEAVRLAGEGELDVVVTGDGTLDARLAHVAPGVQVIPVGEVDVAGRVKAALLRAAGYRRLQRRLERVERSSSEMLYTVTHDVKGQLQGMVGLAGLLAEVEGERLTAEGRAWCERIEATGESLARAVEALLAYVRATGREPRREKVDLAEVVAEVVADRGLDRGATPVVVDVEGALPVVDGDQVMLRRALEALIDNVGRHAGLDEPRCAVAFQAGVLVVTDRGVGVHEDELERVLEPLYRGRGAPDGAGLGLALVHRIAELHDGDVRVERPPGGGCAVRLRLGIE